jgi:hypothetical protein
MKPLVLFQDLEQAPRATKRAAAPKKPKREKPVGEHPLPDGWQPSAAHVAYAAKHGLRLDFEADAFRGWAEGRKALSWNGTFTTRLANSAKWGADKTTKPAGAVQYGRGVPAPDRRQPGGMAKADPEAWDEFEHEEGTRQ